MLGARLSPDDLDPARELDGFLARAAGAGAVVSFTGLTRDMAGDGKPVERLFLDHHPRLTEGSLVAIGEAALARFKVSGIHIVHRCGDVSAGAPIVFVAAAARHRRAAFEAVDYLMDRLKTEAMLWKREDVQGGGRWIEPTIEDVRDRRRWEDRWRGLTRR